MRHIYLLVIALVVTTVVSIFVLVVDKSEEKVCERCNVILISVDTLGSNHLPCYGYQRNTAPNLCRFAEENIMFTNSFSNASWTLPGHFSIFTSLYPAHHGIFGPKYSLDESIPTLPQVFADKGYDTVYAGPLEDINLPLDKGIGKGFKSFFSYEKQKLASWQSGLNRLVENSRKGKSTFLFLHTYWVHSPYLHESSSRESNKRMYSSKTYKEVPLDYGKFLTQDVLSYLRSIDNLPENASLSTLIETRTLDQVKEIYSSLSINDRSTLHYKYYLEILKNIDPTGEYAKALYDEGIYYFDIEFKKFVDSINNSGLFKNTIVIVTSDHGEEFMEHGYLGHPTDRLYNTVTNVPLIMHIPGIKERKIKQMVEGVDILPTILSLVGIDTPESIDGYDLSDHIFNRSNPKTKQFLISGGANVGTIRNSGFKTHYFDNNKNSKKEFYDLDQDPLELNDIYEREREKAEALWQNLESILWK